MMLRFAVLTRLSSAALLLTLLGTTLSCKDEAGVTAIGGDDDNGDDDDDNEGDGGPADDDESASDQADDAASSDATVSPDDVPPPDDMPSASPDDMTEETNGPAPNAGNGGAGSGGGGSSPAPTTSMPPVGVGGDTTTPAPSGTGGASGVAGNANVGGSIGVGGTQPLPTQCPAGVVDDFVSCDIDICAHEGRQGTWFYYAGAGIGIDETQASVRIPPSTWLDQSCAMMLAGGDNLLSVDFYAGVGLALNAGLPYSLVGFNGVTFTIETEAAVYLTLRNGLNEYFIPPTTSGQTVGLQSFSIPLSSFAARSDNPSAVLNLADIVEFQWTVVSPELGFGLAIHSVSLY